MLSLLEIPLNGNTLLFRENFPKVGFMVVGHRI
jgi:hypothetical protein